MQYDTTIQSVYARCRLAMHDVGTGADCRLDADVNPMRVLSMRTTYDARRLSRPTHDVLDACCRCRPTMHDVDAVVDADSRYYTTTFIHLGILLLVDECMNTVNTDSDTDNTADMRQVQVCAFNVAVHGCDDERHAAT